MNESPQVQLEAQQSGNALEIEALQSTPITSWVSGKKFPMSEREQCLIETLVKTESFQECQKAIKEKFKQDWSLQTINNTLKKPHVESYLAECLENKGIASGLTKDAYIVMGYKILMGEMPATSEQVAIYKHLAKVKGFEESGINNMNVTQINFTEKA